MKLLDISENAGFFYGYRTIPGLIDLAAVGVHGLVVPTTTETYWSYEPVLYTYIPGLSKGSVQSNLIEARFRADDPGLCGYGDGGHLYQYLTHLRPAAEVVELADQLPDEVRLQLTKLRNTIIRDPAYNEDWTLAGILPARYKKASINALKLTSMIPPKSRFSKDEFTYLGPIPVEEPDRTSITAVVLYEFPTAGSWKATGAGAKQSVIYSGRQSQIA